MNSLVWKMTMTMMYFSLTASGVSAVGVLFSGKPYTDNSQSSYTSGLAEFLESSIPDHIDKNKCFFLNVRSGKRFLSFVFEDGSGVGGKCDFALLYYEIPEDVDDSNDQFLTENQRKNVKIIKKGVFEKQISASIHESFKSYKIVSDLVTLKSSASTGSTVLEFCSPDGTVCIHRGMPFVGSWTHEFCEIIECIIWDKKTHNVRALSKRFVEKSIDFSKTKTLEEGRDWIAVASDALSEIKFIDPFDLITKIK